MKKLNKNKFLIVLISIIVGFNFSLKAQFVSNAIHADSNIFIDWANGCNVERGYADISSPENGFVTYGADSDGIGNPDNVVVSLGDGGMATITFSVPVADGPGWDFAVFENSFSDDFLELAFVEVSSNGSDYYRFNSISLTQQETQISTFGLLDASMINNLAGKYRALLGVPFDLSELRSHPDLNVSNIVSIRIIDVIGCIDTNYATYDWENRIINDPWPTPFESGGFDLDAIGVINNRDNTNVIDIFKNTGDIIFPNPATNSFRISINEKVEKVIIADINGRIISEHNNLVENIINTEFLAVGYYVVKVMGKESIYTVKLLIQ